MIDKRVVNANIHKVRINVDLREGWECSSSADTALWSHRRTDKQLNI